MKKLILALGLGLMTGTLYAACVGPFCWDDSGISIGGNLYDGNGLVLPSNTKANILAAAPKAKGQLVMCTDCAFAQTVCISTSSLASPATNQYVIQFSTSQACH